MSLIDAVKEFKYYTRSDKVFGGITAAVTLAVYLISYYVIPGIYPGLHIDLYINSFFGTLFTAGFILSLYVFIIRIFGYGYEIETDFFMAGWLYAAMGFVLYGFYHLVLAMKGAYSGKPKIEFFFDGKTNLYSLLNGGMVVSMIAAFIFTPVFAIRYIDYNDYNSKFYSFVAGVFFEIRRAHV